MKLTDFHFVHSLVALALAIGSVALPGSVPPGSAGAQSVGAHSFSAQRLTLAATNSNVSLVVGIQGLGVVAPGAALALDGTITNTSGAALPASNIEVFLSNDVVSKRTTLADWLAGTGSDDAGGNAVFTQPTAEIPAGHTVSFSAVVPATALGLSGNWGARRVLVRLNSDGAIVSTARSSLVWVPGGATPVTPLAITVPITVPNSTDALIPSDLLAAYTSPTGLLTRQLDQVLNRNVTLAIDPMIVASIKILGDTVPESASKWLQALQGASNDSFALTYADSDVTVGLQAGSPTVLSPITFPVNARNFPGSSTASPAPSGSPSASSTPSGSATPAPTPSASPSVAPALPTSQTLMALPYTMSGYVWPAENSVTESDLAALSASGITNTIVSSSNVVYGSTTTVQGSGTTLGGHPALVSDNTIADLINVAASQTTDLGWEQAMAKLSASIAIASAEQTVDSRSLLAGLSRDAAGQNGRLTQTLTALFSLPWVASTSVKALSNSTSASSLKPSAQSAARVSEVRAMLAAEAAVAIFSSVLSDPTLLTGERRLSLLATLGNSWSPTSVDWSAAASKYITKSTELTSSVKIAASSSLFITSKNSHVDVTVQNSLNFPVTVFVSVRAPNGILTVLDRRLQQTIEANSQAKASVPVTSLANGDVVLHVSLTSLTNVQVAQPALIKVDVQAGWETAFTAVFTALLVLLFGFGIFRNIRKRLRARRGGVVDDAEAPVADTLSP